MFACHIGKKLHGLRAHCVVIKVMLNSPKRLKAEFYSEVA
jgi:hypothetical protein